MHPAHVPLEVEAQAAFGDGLRDAGEGRGLLGDHRDAGLIEADERVHLLQELDGLDVLAAAEAVRDPLPGLARVVEIQHGRHRVDAQAVDVEALEPGQRGADQEAAHLVAAVVEDQRPPVLMLAEARIGVLVEVRAVEAGQREEIAREVGRHPVDDHADARAVQRVDERHEIEGRTEAVRRGVEARDLVTPGAVEGMLRRRHQLHMGEAHLRAVGGELRAELPVVQDAAALLGDAAPGGEVHLIDGHRAGAQVGLPAGLQPGLVMPDEAGEVADDRRMVRRRLEVERVRIRLQERRGVMRSDELVFVTRAGGEAGEEDLPDAGSPEAAHRVGAAVPEIVVAYDGDPPGGRGPDREGDPRDAVDRADVGTQLVVGPMVVALAEEEKIVLGDRRQEAVRVVDFPADAVGVSDAETITEERRAGQLGLEDPAGVQTGHRHRLPAFGQQLAGARPRQERTGDQTPALERMQPQEAVRRGLRGVHQGGQLCWAQAHPGRLHGRPRVGKRSLPEKP